MAKEKKEEVQEEKKKGGKLKWIILLVLLLGLAGGGAFAYFKYIQPMLGDKTENTEEKAAEEKKEEEPKAVYREMVSLPPLVVNLADPLGRRYLKVSIDVEINSETGGEKIRQAMPQIKDMLLLLLSSKTYSDLASIANKLDLKTEIVSRMNQVMKEAFITQVYFTEFVIQ